MKLFRRFVVICGFFGGGVETVQNAERIIRQVGAS